MKEFRGTPGPWDKNWAGALQNGQFVLDEVYVYAPACGVDDVAVAADIADPLTGKPSIENARLIAAAPELLAVLEHVSHINGFREFNDYLPTIRAAIAKALGS